MLGVTQILAFALGVTQILVFLLGVMQILVFPLGVTQILAFLDTNMLVSPTRNSRIGGIAQRDGPTSVFMSQWNIGLSPE